MKTERLSTIDVDRHDIRGTSLEWMESDNAPREHLRDLRNHSRIVRFLRFPQFEPVGLVVTRSA